MGEAAAPIAAVASIGALGLSAYSSVTSGQAKSAELQTKAQNYLLEGTAKATNYELEGAAKSTNYLYQGAAQKAQYGAESSNEEMQAQRAERSATLGRTQADLTDATLRDQLATTLGNISVIRAAGHIDPSSPTSAAVMGYEARKADLQREAALTSIHAQVTEDEASAAYLHKAAAFSLTQGSVAEQMAKYNSDTALSYAKYNAAITRQFANLNANSAMAGADTAETTGWLNAGSTILGGVGKAGLGGGGSFGDVNQGYVYDADGRLIAGPSR